MSELPDGAGDLLHLQVVARDLHHQHLPAPSFAVDLFWLLFTVFTIITYYWSTYFRVSQNYVCLHRVLINWRLVTSGAPYLAGSDCQCEPDPVVHGGHLALDPELPHHIVLWVHKLGILFILSFLRSVCFFSQLHKIPKNHIYFLCVCSFSGQQTHSITADTHTT